MFKHLLVPTDGTALSSKAVRAAIDFAKTVNAAVTLITVSEPFHIIAVDDPVLLLQTEEEYLKASAQLAKKILKGGEDYAQSKGVRVDSLHVYEVAPYRAIVGASKGCDLIFMASHGRKGIAALLLGSETQKVLTHAKIPVLVYR